MRKASRFLFITMCIAFGLCIVGLAGGMAYDLFLVIALHDTLETVLGNSIRFYKLLGALGIFGFLLLLVFLLVSVSAGPASSQKPHRQQ